MAVLCELLLLLVLMPLLSQCGATEYYVRPTEPSTISCPGQPCLTLNQYTSNSSHYVYIHSNAVFKFLPGTHHMDRPLVIRDVQNITLQGSEEYSTYSVIIEPQFIHSTCRHHDSCKLAGISDSNLYTCCAVIQLHNVSNVALVGINITSVLESFSRTEIGVLMSNADLVVVRLLAVRNFYHGITLYDVSDSNLTDIVIGNSFSDGMFLCQTNNVSVTNTTSKNNGENGFVLMSSRAIHVVNTSSVGNELNGLSILSTEDCSFIQTITLNNSQSGVNVRSSNFTIFDDVYSQYNEKYGVEVSDVYHAQLANVISMQNEDSGVYLSKMHSMCITNVSTVKNEWAGIEITESYNATLINVITTNNEWVGTGLYDSTYTTVTNISSVLNEWTGVEICRANHTDILHVSSKQNAVYGISVNAAHGTTLAIVLLEQNQHEGIFVSAAYYTSLLKVNSTRNFYGVLIYNSFSTTLMDMKATHNNRSGIYLLSSSATTLRDIYSASNSAWGMLVGSSHNTTMTCISLKNNSQSGLEIISSNSVLMADVVTDRNQWHGIYVRNSSNVEMMNISLVHNAGGSLKVWQTHAVQIKHVSILDNQREGIAIVESSNTLVSNVSSLITAFQSYDIELVNSSFSNKNVSSSTSTVSPTSLPAVIVLYDSTLSIQNCNFTRNTISSLKVIGSNVTVLGDITISNNTATAGTAFIFVKNSTLIVTEKSHMTFRDNYAINNGGVFHISTEQSYTLGLSLDDLIRLEASKSTVFPAGYVLPKYPCFLHVEGQRTQKRMMFENNTSGNGGDVLYGGSLVLGWDGRDWNCLLTFKNVSDMSQQKGYSQISSAPSRVCLCNSVGEPDCLIAGDPHKRTIYPGQTINISAVVVGQDFGTVAGSVYTQFLNSGTNSKLMLNSEKNNPGVESSGCTSFNYTISYSNHDASSLNTVLVLTAESKKVSNILSLKNDRNVIDVWQHVDLTFTAADIANLINSSSIKALLKFTNDGQLVFPDELNKLPVYVNISILECPLGFQLRANPPFKCDCDSLLMQIKGVECQIEDQTISRSGLVWIGKEQIQNKTVAVSEYCPFNYCKNQNTRISLSDPDSQCNYNHSGTLCGGCQSGLSLVLGSDECQTCSNNYLSLLLVFFFAGIMLVVSIKVVDITITQGTMNGLIFYANIVKAIDYIIFPNKDITPVTLFIAWFNLDLGVKVCFFNGLNAYSKTWLQFVFPLYTWSIAWLIIILAKRCDRLAKMMGKNSVSVLATLFLLSYAKLFRTIITTLSFTIIHTSESSKAVWSADGNVDYLSPKHIPLFIVATAILLFLWLPYTLLLFSEQWLHKLNCRVIIRLLIKMKPFLDAHYGSLTDHHRYWFGALLLVKATVLLLSALLPVDHTSVKILSVAISSTVLLFWTQVVYRNQKTSLFNASLFANLILLSATNFFTTITRENAAIAANTLIGVAITQFLGLILFKLLIILKRQSSIVSQCVSLLCRSSLHTSDDYWDQYEQATHNREHESSDDTSSVQIDESGCVDSLPTYGV